MCHGDLSDSRLAELSLNLWNLAQKHGFGNTKYTVSRAVPMSPALLVSTAKVGTVSLPVFVCW